MAKERPGSDSVRVMKEVSDDTSTRVCRAAVTPVIRVQTAIIVVMLSTIGSFTWYAVANSRVQGMQDSRIDSVSQRQDNHRTQLQRIEDKLDRLIERQ